MTPTTRVGPRQWTPVLPRLRGGAELAVHQFVSSAATDLETSPTDPQQGGRSPEFDLDPDDDGVEVFVDHYVDEREEASIPKRELFQTSEAWADIHDLDGTNDVWFARKLGDLVKADTDRRRSKGERIYIHTGIALTDGEY